MSEKDDQHPSSGDGNGNGEEKSATTPEQADTTTANQTPEEKRYSVFTEWQKRGLVVGAALLAFFSPLSAQIYFPALPSLATDFGVSDSKINLTITTYMIFQGITPMFIGSLADSAGRRPAYIICFVVYFAANVGLALSRNYASLLVVRCLQSAGSSSTVALNSAVLADTITSAERGAYVGYTIIPTVLAPTLGPVVGGLLAQYLGWRAIFWFLAILAGVAFVLLLLFFPETSRHLVGDGSLRPPRAYLSVYQLLRERSARRKTALFSEGLAATPAEDRRLKRPKFNLLASFIVLSDKENFLILGYSSIIFAGFYAVVAAMPSQFSTRYGLSESTIGLLYLPIGGGSIAAAFIVGPLMNWNYRRQCKRAGVAVERSKQQDMLRVPIEKARLQISVPLVALTTATLVGWGWSVEAHAHLAVPCVLMFVLGVGMIGISNASGALVIDLNRTRAGAATAANNVTRCLLGAAASYAIVPLIKAIGNGWAFTVVAALFVVFLPALLAVMRWGQQWRAEEKAKREEAEAEKAEANSSTNV